MHPSHEVDRVYEALVLGTPDAHDLDRLARGVVVEGRRTAPAQVELITDPRRGAARSKGDETSVIRVTVHEGRTRQVRKMCDAIGHPVRKLRRVRIGPIQDHTLKSGTFRELTAEEVRKLRSAAHRSSPAQSSPQRTQSKNRGQ
jgi:23S rRNA pseudouridine2605 synthase